MTPGGANRRGLFCAGVTSRGSRVLPFTSMPPLAPVGAAWLARNNRAKQDQNRERAQPGLARPHICDRRSATIRNSAAGLRAPGVFAVIAALFAHDLKPAPVSAGLETSLVEPGNDECRGRVFAFHHVKQPISFPRRM